MTTLRFEIDTDSRYSEDEIDELQTEFGDWFITVDGSAERDTVDVRIVGQKDTNSTSDEMDEAQFKISVELISGDGNVLKKFIEVPEIG